MSLHNVESSSGALVATDTDGYAVSKVIDQDAGENNFFGVKNIIGKFEFANISKSKPNTIEEKENTIPIMTSDTAPSGICSASSIYSASYEPYKSFKNILSEYWSSVADDIAGSYIRYEFEDEKTIVLYSFASRSTTEKLNQCPKDFEFRGSMDGTNWTTLDSHTGIVWTTSETKSFPITNTSKYKFYEIYILDNGGGTYSCVLDVRMNEKTIIFGDTDNLVTVEPIKDGDQLVLVKDDDSIHEIVASGVTGTGPYEMDTTAITGGEVPSRAYRVDEGISINATGSGMDSNAYTYDVGKNILNSDDPFGDGSLLAKYQVDGNADDIVGAYNGLVNNITFGTGRYGSSVITSGGNDSYFEFGPNLFQSGVPFDIVFWIKTKDVVPSSRLLELRSEVKIEFFTQNKSFRCAGATSLDILTNDTWYFIHLSARSSETVIKIKDENGVLIDTMNGSAGLTGGDFSADWLGRNDTNFYPSEFDQLEIYDRELTDQEVDVLYAQRGEVLEGERTFDDVDVSGRTLETKVQMSATGNKMTELTFDIWKEA